jgi:hypothetical protein
MSARIITAGIAGARGVGGRRGRKSRRGWLRIFSMRGETRSTEQEERRALEVREDMIAVDPSLRPLGKRERKRRAKLRRRARDRDLPYLMARGGFLKPAAAERVLRQWSTADGRRRWTEEDCARKRAKRQGA